MILKKKAIPEFDIDEMSKFYKMLLKMKSKRPNMDIDWIMRNLYGNNFKNFNKN